MTNSKKSIILAWFIVVLWMGIIFVFSAQPATKSNHLSKKVTQVIIETVGKVLPLEVDKGATDLISELNRTIRKFAHGLSYFILGILVMHASMISFSKKGVAVFFTLIFCPLYAISDEWHQMFVPGRSAQVQDVIIDTIGAVTGIIIYVGIAFVVKRWKRRIVT